MKPKRSEAKPLVPRRRIPKVVLHPRYGDEVVATGCRAATAEILACYRMLPVIEVFVESAIRADLRRQNHEWTLPKHFYADVLCRCSRCRRRFIFFAREQQFWYEELKINVGTFAQYCCECASEKRAEESALQRCRERWGRTDLDDEALVQLAEDLVVLRKADFLKDDQRLRETRNTLLRRGIDPARWPGLASQLST
jgi:hypothetical protein